MEERFSNIEYGEGYAVKDNQVNGLPLIRVSGSDDAFILSSFLNRMWMELQEFKKYNDFIKDDNDELYEDYKTCFESDKYTYGVNALNTYYILKEGEFFEGFKGWIDSEEWVQSLVEYLNKQDTLIEGLKYDLNGVKKIFHVYTSKPLPFIRRLARFTAFLSVSVSMMATADGSWALMS